MTNPVKPKSEYQKGWKKYPPNSLFYTYAECFYQKKLGEDFFMNVVQYPPFQTRPMWWEVDFDLEFKGKCMRVKLFNYMELNFKLMERHVREIARRMK